jgi:predicted DNA-binding protein
MATAVKRAGRPLRSAEKGERYSLGLIVTAEMKQFIDDTAKATGRTQSQVAELLMEKAVAYDRMLSAMNTSLEEIRRGQIEAAFRAAGFTAIHSPYGKIWVPKDYPMERSRFLAQDEVDAIEKKREERK